MKRIRIRQEGALRVTTNNILKAATGKPHVVQINKKSHSPLNGYKLLRMLVKNGEPAKTVINGFMILN